SLAKMTSPRNAISALLPFSRALQSTDRAAVFRSSDTNDPRSKSARLRARQPLRETPERSASAMAAWSLHSVASSVRSVASPRGQDCRYRLQNDDDVSAKRPVLHIGPIERNPTIVGGIVAAADLPGPGEPRANLEIEMSVRAVHPDFVDDDRPRAHDAHLAP